MRTYSYSENDELVWAALLDEVSTNETEPVLQNYLFKPDDAFSEEFWRISSEVAQLNDYCVLCLEGVTEKLDSLQCELSDLKSGRRTCDTTLGDFTGEVIMMLEDEVPVWQDTNDYLVRATCFVLLLSLTERILKTLCLRLAPQGANGPTFPRHRSKISSYIIYLQDECHIPFSQPPEFTIVEDQARIVRNQFAHGDWDELRSVIKEASLRKSFFAVSLLLKEIENATWKSIWKSYITDRK